MIPEWLIGDNMPAWWLTCIATLLSATGIAYIVYAARKGPRR